jgi:8-oxo-dGTP pyrophosphatase MutT (NUDIX family)
MTHNHEGHTQPPVTGRSRHFTASAVVIDLTTAEVLLIDHRATGRRQPPGGHVDADQAGHEAAIREVLEETGVQAVLWTSRPVTIPGGAWMPSPFLVCEFPAPPKPAEGEPAHAHIDLLYLATADSTVPVTAQVAEVTGAVWLPIHTLATAAVREDVPVVVPLAWEYMTGTRPANVEHTP